MNKRMLALAGVLLAAAPAAAQRTISPGMTEAQVRSVLGPPATTRSTTGWTYLYYQNGCPIRCGSDDVVFLQDGRVVAAVFRTGVRRFAGPAADDALEAGGADVDAGASASTPARMAPAVVGGIRVDDGATRQRAPIGGRTAEPAGTAVIRDDGGDPARPLQRAGSRAVHDVNRAALGDRESGITTGTARDSAGIITPTGIPPRSERDTTRNPRP